MIAKPGDLVRHADWHESPLNSYRQEVGLVVCYDNLHNRMVEVVWLPVQNSIHKNGCKIFHCVESLEVIA